MPFGCLRRLVFISVLRLALSIPLDPPNETPEIVLVTAVITTKLDFLETTTVFYPPNSLPTSPGEPSSDELAPSATEILIVTATITETPTTTITVTESPAATTDVTTASPGTSQTPSSQTAWAAPPQFTDLSCFRVSLFAYGQRNLQLVSELATNATTGPTTSPPTFGENATLSALQQDPHTLLQIFYPQGSINPDSDPQGGADFYASPLDFSRARSVTLEYSVFFPLGFEWALAGKLPGLYGGHTGCSGGNDARSCFSTRLMWRKGGKGELYLYAPKDKQTKGLCSTPPQSFCDAEYGLSVGRGSFHFSMGDWTHLRQTVSLNTPGRQDGGFVLFVNGQEVINRSDVFYRDAQSTVHSSPTSNHQPTSSPSTSQPSDGGLLDGLIGGLLGGLGDVFYHVASPKTWDFYVMPNGPPEGSYHTAPIYYDESQIGSSKVPQEQSSYLTSPLGGSEVASVSLPYATTLNAPLITETTAFRAPTTTATQLTILPGRAVELMQQPRPVGFSGLFFSTFFGGHDLQYASPDDQYAWFKDFAITINEES